MERWTPKCYHQTQNMKLISLPISLIVYLWVRIPPIRSISWSWELPIAGIHLSSSPNKEEGITEVCFDEAKNRQRGGTRPSGERRWVVGDWIGRVLQWWKWWTGEGESKGGQGWALERWAHCWRNWTQTQVVNACTKNAYTFGCVVRLLTCQIKCQFGLFVHMLFN